MWTGRAFKSSRKPGTTFRLLPGGGVATLQGAGTLAGSYGEACTFVRATAGTIVKTDGTVVSVASGSPRVGATGYLAEPERTNLCLRSQDFGNATWTKIGSGSTPAVVQDAAVAPDGTMTAAAVSFPAVSGGAAFALLRQNILATAVDHSTSVWMRTGGGTSTVWMGLSGTNDETPCTVTPTWTRFVCTQVSGAVGRNFDIGVNRFETNQTDQAAQVIYIWGAQMEAGAGVSSYIPTTTAAATRNVDVALFSPTSMPGARGSIGVTFVPSQTNTFGYFFDTRNAGSGGAGVAALCASATEIQFFITDGGASAFFTSAAGLAWTVGTPYRISIVWDGTSLKGYRNGAQVGTTPSTVDPTGHSKLFVGVRSDSVATTGAAGGLYGLTMSKGLERFQI